MQTFKYVSFVLLAATTAFSAHAAPTIYGVGDVNFNYNLNHPPLSQDVAGSPQTRLHSYDRNSRQFQLTEFTLGAKGKEDRLSYNIAIGTGAKLDLLNRVDEAADTSYRFVRRADATYHGSSGSVTFGRFDADFGFESIDASKNWNYGHSFAYTLAQPQFFTGALGKLPSGEGEYLVGVANGINRYSDNNIAKTWITGYDSSGFGAHFAIGPENASNGSDWRATLNMHAKKDVSAKLGLGLNAIAVYGENDLVSSVSSTGSAVSSGHAFRYGLAGFLRMVHEKQSSTALRLEGFRDAVGAATLLGSGRTLYGVTATHRKSLTSRFDLWFEGRFDFSDKATFFEKTGTNANLKKTQGTALIAGTFQI